MIYYVEDDEQIRNLTLYTLTQAGFAAQGMTCAQELYAALDEEIPELILLDVMLPDEDGLSICAHLRADDRTAELPIMMLTAKGTEYDTVLGLDSGADDYLAKPFGMMEMLSRVNALLRRANRAKAKSQEAHGQGTLSSGPITVDESAHAAYVDGEPVVLTRKEFDLLAYLLNSKGTVISRERLLTAVWDYDIMGETRTVDAHIQTLRKKLSSHNPEAGAQIMTVRGVGYRVRSDAE